MIIPKEIPKGIEIIINSGKKKTNQKISHVVNIRFLFFLKILKLFFNTLKKFLFESILGYACNGCVDFINFEGIECLSIEK